MVIDILDHRIVIDCDLGIEFHEQGYNIVKPETIMWDAVDAILISSYTSILALPLITQYSRFRGRIFATLPTIQFGRLAIQELIDYITESNTIIGGKPLYHQVDIQESISKIEPIYFHDPKVLSNRLIISAVSSGGRLGGCNWVIQADQFKMTYLTDLNRTPHPYIKDMDMDALREANHVLISPGIPTKVSRRGKDLPSLWSQLEPILLGSGTIYICLNDFDELFEMISIVYSLLGNRFPELINYVVMPGARDALHLANIFTEWFE